MEDVKSFLRSKTFWLTGVVPIAIAVVDAIIDGADYSQLKLVFLGALAIVLRRFTSGAMDFRLPPK